MTRFSFVNRACPICKKPDASVKRQVKRAGITYHIVKCNACSFVYVRNPNQLTYVDEQRMPGAVLVRARHRHIKALCDSLLANIGESENGHVCQIVEIGSGWGGLAQTFASDKRYVYTGFEPSADRARYCAAAGFSVRAQSFLPSALSAKVDAVILDNVLEHVREPAVLLQDAALALASR